MEKETTNWSWAFRTQDVCTPPLNYLLYPWLPTYVPFLLLSRKKGGAALQKHSLLCLAFPFGLGVSVLLNYRFFSFRFLWPCIVSKVWREKTKKCNNYMFIINFCFNMFRASLCSSSGEQRPCYWIWCVVLVLLDVVVSGCGALRCRVWSLWRFLFNCLC